MIGESSTEALNQVDVHMPLTGSDYLESLRDGRCVYMYGDRVRDVTRHSGFANTSKMVARLYDALHSDPTLTVPTESGSGRTHPFFRTPRSVGDLERDHQAIRGWSRLSYGWLGRSPDYKASFLGTLGANSDFYGDFAENARTWYLSAQSEVQFWSHAIVNPPLMRDDPKRAGDLYLHVDKETDAGLLVSGAKVVATSAALTHHCFVANLGPSVREKRHALIAAVPMDSAGLKILSRPSFAVAAQAVGSPADYPLSSRLDENDSILLFDQVLIPWENVFSYGSLGTARTFASQSGFTERANFHGCIRLVVKLEFLIGLLSKCLELAGTHEFRGVQTRLGEVLAWRDTFAALADASVSNPRDWMDAVLPNTNYTMAYRTLMQTAYPRVREIFLQDVASGLSYMNSHADDFANPEIKDLLSVYLAGSSGQSAEQRSKVVKLAWDAVGSEFAGRHELYERNYTGNHEATKIELLQMHQLSGDVQKYQDLVDECLSEYDLTGWLAPDLSSPDTRSVRLAAQGGFDG